MISIEYNASVRRWHYIVVCTLHRNHSNHPRPLRNNTLQRLHREQCQHDRREVLQAGRGQWGGYLHVQPALRYRSLLCCNTIVAYLCITVNIF